MQRLMQVAYIVAPSRNPILAGCAVLAAWLMAGTAVAEELVVPTQYTTIQSAIDAATSKSDDRALTRSTKLPRAVEARARAGARRTFVWTASPGAPGLW